MRGKPRTCLMRGCGNPPSSGARGCVEHADMTIPRIATLRKCVWCSVEFNSKQSKYCSPFCRNTKNNQDKIERSVGVVIPLTKHCNKCDETREAVFFSFSKYHYDGLHPVCRVCKREDHKVWRKENPDNLKDAHLYRNYGLTRNEYDSLLSFQDGACYICKKNPKDRRLSVDHDHETGAIRALLCNDCNKSLIRNHTIDILLKAVEYLRNPPAPLHFGSVRTVPLKNK